VGDSQVTVPQGAIYIACLPHFVSNCDQGATASVPGYNSSSALLVYACAAQSGIANPSPYSFSGLLYCSINTAVPGTYQIMYTVTYMGVSASVTRTVTVTPACPSGSQVCPDNTCSDGKTPPFSTMLAALYYSVLCLPHNIIQYYVYLSLFKFISARKIFFVLQETLLFT
jgi:hypothetical protein